MDFFTNPTKIFKNIEKSIDFFLKNCYSYIKYRCRMYIYIITEYKISLMSVVRQRRSTQVVEGLSVGERRLPKG